MNNLYFDCFSGVSGDMILGALLDILDVQQRFLDEIKKLGLTGYKINIKKKTTYSILATDVDIIIEEKTNHTNFFDIKSIINKSDLNTRIKENAIAIFLKLAKVESKIHNTSIDKIHFHEVGAVDSIIDIVGSCILMELLDYPIVTCSKINVGHGFVSCRHGVLPVPAPATIELLIGVPVYSFGNEGERVTPTGASVITHFATEYGQLTTNKISKIGYGMGKKDYGMLNCTRVFLCKN